MISVPQHWPCCATKSEIVNRKTQLAGIGFGLLAYGIWGFFPLYFRQLAHVLPMDILANRAVWACVFVGILLTLRQRWASVLVVFKNPRQLAMLALAALLAGCVEGYRGAFAPRAFEFAAAPGDAATGLTNAMGR